MIDPAGNYCHCAQSTFTWHNKLSPLSSPGLKVARLADLNINLSLFKKGGGGGMNRMESKTCSPSTISFPSPLPNSLSNSPLQITVVELAELFCTGDFSTIK